MKKFIRKALKRIQEGSNWGKIGTTNAVAEFIRENVSDEGELVVVSNTQIKLCTKEEALVFCQHNPEGWTSVLTDEILKDAGEAIIGALLT